jgi:hypothetical protein
VNPPSRLLLRGQDGRAANQLLPLQSIAQHSRRQSQSHASTTSGAHPRLLLPDNWQLFHVQLQNTVLPDRMQERPLLKKVELPDWIADVPSLKTYCFLIG